MLEWLQCVKAMTKTAWFFAIQRVGGWCEPNVDKSNVPITSELGPERWAALKPPVQVDVSRSGCVKAGGLRVP